MVVLLKQCQSGLVPFKSCKLESKTRAKVFGKVDTTETYQVPKVWHLRDLHRFSSVASHELTIQQSFEVEFRQHDGVMTVMMMLPTQGFA